MTAEGTHLGLLGPHALTTAIDTEGTLLAEGTQLAEGTHLGLLGAHAGQEVLKVAQLLLPLFQGLPGLLSLPQQQLQAGLLPLRICQRLEELSHLKVLPGGICRSQCQTALLQQWGTLVSALHQRSACLLLRGLLADRWSKVIWSPSGGHRSLACSSRKQQAPAVCSQEQLLGRSSHPPRFQQGREQPGLLLPLHRVQPRLW